MAFPEVKFGICPRCGRRGYDIDSDTLVSTASTGYELKEYDGEWLCQLCINELEDKKHLEIFNDLTREEEKARDVAGFEKP